MGWRNPVGSSGNIGKQRIVKNGIGVILSMADIIDSTPAELVYLVKEFEGTILPGISDPFARMSNSDRAAIILDVESSLESKGLQERTFGGRITFDTSLVELITICARFHRYIGIDYRKKHGNVDTDRYYELEGKWLRITGDNSVFHLACCSGSEISSKLNALPRMEQMSDDISALVSKAEGKQIEKYMSAGKIDEVLEHIEAFEANDTTKRLLRDGISNEVDFATVTIMQRDSDLITSDSASVLISNDTVAEFYQAVSDDNRTMIGIRSVQQGQWGKINDTASMWVSEEKESD